MMWWLIPAAITAAVVVIAGYAVGQMSRSYDPGYGALMLAFMMIGAAVISIAWGAYFVVGALLG